MWGISTIIVALAWFWKPCFPNFTMVHTFKTPSVLEIPIETLTRGSQEPESLTWLNFCFSRAMTLTWSCLGRTYHEDYFINWKFHSICYSFDIDWKLQKKCNFSSLKGNIPYMESSDNFDPWTTFVGLMIRIFQQLKDIGQT